MKHANCLLTQWRVGVGSMLLALSAAYAPTVLAGNPVAGEQIYSTFCVGCHGVGGRNPIAGAPSFARGEGLMKPDMTLVQSIKSGRMAMPAFAGVISDREINDVITYLRTLR